MGGFFKFSGVKMVPWTRDGKTNLSYQLAIKWNLWTFEYWIESSFEYY